ncbi:hypothetical protein RP20_CCG002075 [Aedes albopictus]|nr:hypothetical protein RP20_CCG002075 [Aedes albopictus]
MKLLVVALATVAVFFAVVVYGESSLSSSSFQFYQEQIEQLSRNATFQLQVKRESHRLEIVRLTREALGRIGTDTVRGRQRTAEAFEFIDSFNGELSDAQEVCLEEAYDAQRKYSQVLDDDLSHCASKVYNKTDTDASEQFRDVAGTVQLAAFLAVNQAVIAFEVEDSEEERVRYLREGFEYWSSLWELYSSVLDRYLEEQRLEHEEVIQFVEMCLTQALFFFDYTIEYVKDNLENCFAK